MNVAARIVRGIAIENPLRPIGGGSRDRTYSRAYPEFKVYGEQCLLAFKPIPPTFKSVGAGGIVVDNPGRILMEFTPRGNPHDGSAAFRYDAKANFALSSEELGLVLSQVPTYRVELSRNSKQEQPPLVDGAGREVQAKVLTIEQPEHSTGYLFSLDFSRGGAGAGGIDRPLSVELQAGEFEAVRELFRFAIPHLTGWDALLRIQSDAAVASAYHHKEGGNYRQQQHGGQDVGSSKVSARDQGLFDQVPF